MNKVTSTIKENHVKTIKELRKRISELEDELAQWTTAEANDYGKSQQRIAELEAALNRRKNESTNRR